MKAKVLELLTKIVSLGDTLTDTTKQKLQHRFLVLMAILMSFGGIIWGAICVVFDLVYISLIPFFQITPIYLKVANLSFVNNSIQATHMTFLNGVYFFQWNIFLKIFLPDS